jgi:hypothetical protein
MVLLLLLLLLFSLVRSSTPVTVISCFEARLYDRMIMGHHQTCRTRR